MRPKRRGRLSRKIAAQAMRMGGAILLLSNGMQCRRRSLQPTTEDTQTQTWLQTQSQRVPTLRGFVRKKVLRNFSREDPNIGERRLRWSVLDGDHHTHSCQKILCAAGCVGF